MNETQTGRFLDAPPAGADLVIVGAGLAGLVAASRAAAAGADALVIAAPERPAAAAVAAGMIAPVGEVSWGEQRMASLAVAAAVRWPEFATELERGGHGPVPYRRCGALHVALDADEAAELRRRDGLLAEAGLEAESLLGSAARSLEPALSPAVAAATSAPAEAEVDPRALLGALRHAAAQGGAAFLAAEVSAIGAAGEIALASGERIDGGRVLLAAGAWSGLAGLLPAPSRLPVRPVGGQILRLRAERGDLPCERIIVGERFYLVPRLNGEIVLGATTEERGFDARVTAGGVHELLREAYRALPELAELELVEVAAGLRPGSPDNAPIFGELEGTVISVAGGLYRNGILLAPMLAAGFDALLAGLPLPPELAGLGPDRFALGREQEPVR